jgi:transketolase
MRNTFVDTVTAAAVGRSDLMFISGDAGLGVFDTFSVESPHAFLNMGVAEQNTTSFAAGLALTGCKVYLYNIIPFLMYRCYEQVRNDICYQKLPVVLVGIGSGVTYAPAGMSHYAVEDVGLAATLPNLTVISPCDAHEARAAAEYSLTAAGPVYIRMAKRGEAVVHSAPLTDITAPQLIKRGEKCALLFHGSIGDEAVEAVRILHEQGIHITLVSLPMLQPLDENALSVMFAGHELVVTLEEHYAHNGLGAIVSHMVARQRPAWRLFTKGLPNEFIHNVNDTAGMRRRFGLTGAQIAGQIREALS